MTANKPIKLKMQTGMSLMNNVKDVDGDRIRFIAEDGREMFEVAIIDGRTIEVRAVDTCAVGGTLYSSYLEIAPKASNVIEVKTSKFQ